MLALAWRRRDNIGSVKGSLATVFARDGVYYFLVLSCESQATKYHQDGVLTFGPISGFAPLQLWPLPILSLTTLRR